MTEQPLVRRVMISSTAVDLPDHRRQAREACERMSMLPLVMEQMPSSPDDALTLSRKYVDGADFYLGIFAFRYGFVPDGHDKSITELEYERAVQRGIPIFIYIADNDHVFSAAHIETGLGATKLQTLRERLRKAHVVRTFKTAEELRTEIIISLAAYRQDDAAKLHYVAEIPPPPAPWVAHWYSLLGNRRLIGRQAELNRLTDWVTRPSSELYSARLLALVAIGGMGKSALAWTWWNDIAPNEVKPLAGRMWWSFYESDARLENFTARALAYLTRKARVVTEQIPVRDREDQLLSLLDREPYLVVLDGLERELVAYGRIDAAHLSDDDLDAKTANFIAQAAGLPSTAAQSFVGEARLRQAIDPRSGEFLRRLTNVRASRILVTTRLFPFDLQSFAGDPMPGSGALFVSGLSDDDAVALWRSANISGARDSLVPLFRSFEGHPLLVQTLAGEIARDRKTPGDFEGWRQRHPDFDPFALPLVQRKSHVLAYALQGLTSEELALIRAIAGFRMPASYETLAALLVGEDQARHPFPNDDALDRSLADLDERALVGWDRRANRYDLHPIVRGVVWSGAGDQDKQAIAERMRAHFEPLAVPEWERVQRLEDLTPGIELFVSLIRLGKFLDAVHVFNDRLSDALLWRLSAARQRIELVEMLFPNGLDQPPLLDSPRAQSYALNALAQGYLYDGQVDRAAACFKRSIAIDEAHGDETQLPIVLTNLSDALRYLGALHDAEGHACRALRLMRAEFRYGKSPILRAIGQMRAIRGVADNQVVLHRSLALMNREDDDQGAGLANGDLAEAALLRGDGVTARKFANEAWRLAAVWKHERDFINAASLQGAAALLLGDLDVADERLNHALVRARAVNRVEEELAALTRLAQLHDRRGNDARARELLDSVWDTAERGPYPLLHADARNTLAQIEIRAGNTDRAAVAATRAYRLAWCDGPPFAYHHGLTRARAHLGAIGVPEPVMPPFDASKHDPIEDISAELQDAVQ
jgi:tetratricopeptide (TPR) repeat protein